TTSEGLPEDLGDSASIVECREKHIVLSGGTPSARGNLYAVYDYLEQMLGIRWLTPDVEIVPHREKIPDAFRSIRTRLAFPLGRASLKGWVSHYFTREQGSAFYARLRQTGNWLMFDLGNDGKYGHGIHRRPLGHSIPHLIPHKKYFAEHPEWFALMPDGSRCPWSDEMGIHVSQLCLSNRELQMEFVKCVTAYWNENWEKSWRRVGEENVVLNLTQADNSDFCRCPECQAEYQRYGHSGQLLRFITPAVKELEKKYPKIHVRTSAYLHTLQPPKEVDIPPNVMVNLSGLHYDNGKPLASPQNAGLLELLKRWTAVCACVGYTHYSANYHNFLYPVDNLFILADDYRLVRDMGVQSVYDLSSAGGMCVDFEELRFYVTAKLQANPLLDTGMLIREFTDGYYGPAAPFVRDYLHLLHERTVASGMKVESFYKCPAFFDLGFLARAERLFESADRTAQGFPEIQRRLRKDRLHLLYMDLLWLSLRYTPEQLESRIAEFQRDCKEFQVKRFDEDSKKSVEGIVTAVRSDHRQVQKSGAWEVYPPIRYFGFGNLSELTLADGTRCLRLLPTSDNWVLQWICPWFFACPDQPLDAFVLASIELDQNQLDNPEVGVCRGGFSDEEDNATVIPVREVSPGFQLYKIASGVTHKKTGKYLFFTALQEKGVKQILVKSFLVRPSDAKTTHEQSE
ncbi:MAG: DUF4838 domain-containing protein, partial [Victivallales bacterium]|nr:DUF4838 domain-containing protein [Victivallales bacterium]